MIMLAICMVFGADEQEIESGKTLTNKKQEKRGINTLGYGASGLGYDSGLGYGGYASPLGLTRHGLGKDKYRYLRKTYDESI